MTLDDLLRAACQLKASDLHLKVGNAPHVRIDGELRALPHTPKILPEQVTAFAAAMMSARQRQHFEEQSQIDLAYGVVGLARFRASVYRQRGSTAIAMR